MRFASAWARAACAIALLASLMVPLGTPAPVGASASSESAVMLDDTGSTGSRPLQPRHAQAQAETEDNGGPAQSGEAEVSAPSIDDGFALTGTLLAAGLVGLDWDDVPGASGYELLFFDGDAWQLLSRHHPAGSVVAVFDGSSARVGGLDENAGEHWFAVRARSADGVSRWSPGISVAAGVSLEAEMPFDPFTEPTVSDIDLERLGEATASVTPGEADCSAVPALDVTGVSMVDPPADLNDPDNALTVAEVVRIVGGCVVVQYAALAGRTVAQVRELLATEPTVQAVGEPIRGLVEDHDAKPGYVHPKDNDQTGHHDDNVRASLWHITPDIKGMWDDWDDTVPVVVAVLDSGVGTTHPDLDSRIATNSLGGCHAMDASGHGTHVAGIIAAEHGTSTPKNQSVAGVAPKAQLLPLRVLKRNDCPLGVTPRPLTPPAAIAEAVNRGARVINMSIRGTSPHDQDGLNVGGVPIPRVDTYETVLRAASMLGVVTVASAGNCGSDADHDGDGEPGYEENGCDELDEQQLPALYPDVVTVAATEHAHDKDRGIHADFSTANEHVDIAAPGARIRSTDCDSASPPVCDTTGRKSGTSMAAPFVAGVVAHMINRHPDATVGQIRRALEGTTIAPLRPDLGDLTERGRVGDDDLIAVGGKLLRSGNQRFYERVVGHPTATSGYPDGRHAPTKEYGRGIVNPTKALQRLGDDLTALEVRDDFGRFTELSAGARHTCGLRVNGRAVCWGDTAVVDATPKFAFRSLSSPPTARFVCGVRKADSAAQCWGQLPSQVTSPVAVPPDTGSLRGRFVQVAAGDRHVCGVRPDGGVVCWGDSSDEQTTIPSSLKSFSEASGRRVEKIVAGSAHSCALLAAVDLKTIGEVRCWGDDGLGRTAVPSSFVTGDIAAGAAHTCAVATMGEAKCWGDNSHAQRTAPSGRFARVWAGADHNCALAASSELLCWGEDADGRLLVPSLAGTRDGYGEEVSLGGKHGCALTALKEVRCWGDDEHGQAPKGSAGKLGSLSLTVGGADVLAGRFDPDVLTYRVTAGAGSGTLRAAVGVADGSHSRIVLPDGKGGETFPLSNSVPVRLAGRTVFEVRVAAIFGLAQRRVYRVVVDSPPQLDSLRLVPSGSGPHCVPRCAALTLDPAFDPDVTRYGAVALADVAELTVEHRSSSGSVTVTPTDSNRSARGHQVPLSTASGFVALSAGWYHACGLKTDGSVDCWGYARWGSYGQSNAPSGTFTSVTAGLWYSCGLKSAGSIVCWGSNDYGQRTVPSGTFTAVEAGRFHTCGIKTDKSVVCWGDNRLGQAAAPSGSFTAISVDAEHSCGLKTDKSVVCWGTNAHGQTSVAAGSYKTVSVGSAHACGLKTDSTVACWGFNGQGQTDAPSGTFTQVSAGWAHSCAVKPDRSVVCWGLDDVEQSSPPTGAFTAVSAGRPHTCALRPDTSVVCWGYEDVLADLVSPLTVSLRVADGPSSPLSTTYTVQVQRTQAQGGGAQAAGSAGAVSLGCGTAASCAHTAAECADPANKCEPAAAGSTAAEQGAAGAQGIDASGGAQASTGGSNQQSTGAAGASGGGGRCAPSAVTISDAVLRAAVEDALGKTTGATVTPAELAGLTELRLGRYGDASDSDGQVSSLAGLEGATGLVTLDLAGQDVADVGPLACARDTLKTLVLSGNPVDGLAAVSTLIALETLWLDGADIDDIADLAELRSLRRLYLYGNDITDVSPLAVLTQLTDLHLDYNEIRHITSLSALSGLRAFGVGGNWLEVMDAAASMSGLEELYVYDNDIGDLSPVASMRGLETLWASGNDFSDLTPLSGLTRLAYADMRRNRISDPTPLYGLASRTAHLLPQQDDIVIFDESALATAVHDAVGDPDIEAITKRQTARLTSLTYRGDQPGRRAIGSLAGLEHASALTSLDVAGNLVSDLAPLAGLAKLASLNLADNKVTGLDALAGLTALTSLDLSGNRIAGLGPLTGLSSLETLDLTDADLDDISPLVALTGLTTLRIANNCITDFSALDAIAGLTIVGTDDQRQRASSAGTPGNGSSGPGSRTCQPPTQIGLGPGSGLGFGSGPGGGFGF